MAKSAKKTSTKKVKKSRTPEQKAARKLRRAQRKANIKSTAAIKENIDAPVTHSIPSPWAKKETSDGLPFSKSVDNPDSILGQLKRMEILAAKEKADKAAEAAKKLKDFRTPTFAGWTGRSKPNVASFGE
jgi:hypothetical protein